MLDSLLERYRQGDRHALARLLTLVSRGEGLERIAASLPPQSQSTRVVAITGSGGVGKSSLVGKLVELARRGGARIAVLACDPQSPVSGGALLGDRMRMTSETDEGVFIRSLAAASGNGAVAEHLSLMVRLLKGFGFDTIVVETVGAGQGDVSVRRLADVVVLLVQPEAGDDLQWEKAGVLEVADIVVVHKGDLPKAELIESQVRSMLALTEGYAPTVLRASARTGEGIQELWEAILASPGHAETDLNNHAGLLEAARSIFERKLGDLAKGGRLADIELRWQAGQLDDERMILELLRAATK
jgi:LAO/AO transport system ATPase